MATVKIIEFDDAGNVVSTTESRVFSPDSPEALDALFAAYEDKALDALFAIDPDFDSLSDTELLAALAE